MHRHAFTLIELLVVISIIAVLASMLLPAMTSVRQASRGMVCLGNLRQIGMGLASYTESWDGVLPNAFTPSPLGDPAIFDGANYGHWGQEGVVGQYLDCPGMKYTWLGRPSGVLNCPNSQFLYGAPAKYLEYGLNLQLCAAIPAASKSLSQVKRKAMTAIATDTSEARWLSSWLANAGGLLVYADPDAGPVSWTSTPNNQPFDWVMRHRRGANLLFVDGHTSWSKNVSQELKDGVISVDGN